MSKKGLNKKKRLAKANRRNRRIPPFVFLKTNRRVTANRYRRDWRTDKLHITTDEE